MRLTVLRDVFDEALNKVVRAIDSRPTLPVLANVLLDVQSDALRITATNQEASITTEIGASIQETGSITVDAMRLSALVSSFGGERVEMVFEAPMRLRLRSGKANAVLAGIGAEEFPPTPEVNVRQQLRLKFEDLDWLIRRTIYAVAQETYRPVYMGVTLRVTPTRLTAQGMDGFYGAVAHLDIEGGWVGEYIIPAKALEYVQKVFSGDFIQIAVGELGRNQHMIFDDGRVNVRSLLISGKATNIEAAKDGIERNIVRVETEAFRSMLKRAYILGKEVGHQAYLEFLPQDGGVQVTLSKSERGDFDEFIPAAFEGEGFQTMLDLKRLSDSIQSMVESTVLEFRCNGGNDAFIVSGVGDSFALMMPLDPKKAATPSETTATMPVT